MDSTAAVLPTRSHTWVEPSAVTFGWLAGTRRIWTDSPSLDAERAAAWDLFAPVRDALASPSNMNARSTYYRRGFACDDGSAATFYDGLGRAAGTVMVTVRQSVFERLSAAESDGLVRSLTGALHVSRLDLAADVPTAEAATPADLYAMLAAARSRSRPEHRVLTLSQSGEEKLTIGSRASARYLRVYLKGDRVRHEVELKQDVAGYAVLAWREGAALAEVWRDQYERVIRWH